MTGHVNHDLTSPSGSILKTVSDLPYFSLRKFSEIARTYRSVRGGIGISINTLSRSELSPSKGGTQAKLLRVDFCRKGWKRKWKLSCRVRIRGEIIQKLHSGDPFPISQGGVNQRKDSGLASELRL